MQLVKVDPKFYAKCHTQNTDKELLANEKGRPCVLLVRLNYKGAKRDFVVPLRSNISPITPKSQYFPLPPNAGTRPNHHHGIHYIKLFPIDRQYIQKYRIENNAFLTQIHTIINHHQKEIVKACQDYLSDCERGNAHPMTPDLDGILSWLSHP